jgi:hypothetical protein
MGAAASLPAAAGLSDETKTALDGLPSEAKKELEEKLSLLTGSPQSSPCKPPPAQPLAEVQADSSLTCVARVQASLDAIAAQDARLRACIEVLKDSALQTAAEADSRLAAGGARRPLEGVPLLVKANIDVAGANVTAAMVALKDHRPTTSAPVVSKVPCAAWTGDRCLGSWPRPLHGRLWLRGSTWWIRLLLSSAARGNAAATSVLLLTCREFELGMAAGDGGRHPSGDDLDARGGVRLLGLVQAAWPHSQRA